jgi:hypothetical protein
MELSAVANSTSIPFFSIWQAASANNQQRHGRLPTPCSSRHGTDPFPRLHCPVVVLFASDPSLHSTDPINPYIHKGRLGNCFGNGSSKYQYIAYAR